MTSIYPQMQTAFQTLHQNQGKVGEGTLNHRYNVTHKCDGDHWYSSGVHVIGI